MKRSSHSITLKRQITAPRYSVQYLATCLQESLLRVRSIAMTQRQPRRVSVRLAQALAADHRPSHTATDRRTASRLSQLTVPELRQRLKGSGLPVGGSKAQLVERLQTQRDQPTDSRARLRHTATETPAYRRARTRKHGSSQE